MNIAITGASSGVGDAAARYFAQKDCKVFALARSADKLEALAAEFPGRIVACPLDVSRPGDVRDVFDSIHCDGDALDVLVNNAAVLSRQWFHAEDWDMIDQVVDINLKGAMYCARAALPAMMERGRGHIFNVASIAGITSFLHHTVYCASKAGMIAFSEALAREAREHGVMVTALCPGTIRTPLWEKDPGEFSKPAKDDDQMEPIEIAEIIDFVLSRRPNTLFKNMVMFPGTSWA